MPYTVKWLIKGFTVPVYQECPDENTARLAAIHLLSDTHIERVNFFPSNEAEEQYGDER